MCIIKALGSEVKELYLTFKFVAHTKNKNIIIRYLEHTKSMTLNGSNPCWAHL